MVTSGTFSGEGLLGKAAIISKHFSLVFLGGDTTAPNGLYAELCQAFLVRLYFAL